MIKILRTHGVPGLLQMRDGIFTKLTKSNCEALFLEKLQNIKKTNEPIKLCSCYSADNGRFSNAQVMANHYKIPVMGFYGVTDKNIASQAVGSTDKHPIFYPQKSKLSREISELGNNFIGNLLKIRIFITNPTIPEPFKH